MKQKPVVKFYAWSTKYNRRMLFVFRVNNEADAKNCLKRFRVPSGWYCYGNTNRKISP